MIAAVASYKEKKPRFVHNSIIEAIVGQFQQLVAKPDMTQSGASQLLQQLDAVDRQFAERGEMLNGVSSS